MQYESYEGVNREYRCYNGTDWYLVFTTPVENLNEWINEEGMLWNVTRTGNWTSNVTLKIDATNIWNYTSYFNHTNNKTINLAPIINRYMNSTYLVGSNYLIPFNFYSLTEGIIKYFDLNFENLGFLENYKLFNSSTYQTAYESFTTSLNGTITSVNLIYDETSYAASQSGSNWTAHIMMSSSSSGNKSFYWSIVSDVGTSASSTSYQYINPIEFKLCNLTTNNTYGYGTFLNITFKNEVTDAKINGTLVPLTAKYYLFDSTSYKTLSFTNTSINNPNYAFCFNPIANTMKAELSITSSMTDYPARTWSDNLSLSNMTTNQTIYLISSANGVYQPVTVTDGNGAAINGATIEASTVASGVVDTRTTDSSGQATLWLNPDVLHTLVTSKSGYPTDTRNINPTTTMIYIVLGTAAGFTANDSITYNEGLTYSISPTLDFLYNGTSYNFALTVNHGVYDIDNFGFILYNSSNSIVGSAGSIANGGTISLNYNVGNNSVIKMIANWTSHGNTSFVSKSWSVTNTDDTGYSLFNFGNRLKTYITSGMFGLTAGFALNLVCFIIILITTGILSYKFGINNPLIIAIIAAVLVVIFELGFGFIEMGDNRVPLSFWAMLVVLGLGIREALT